MTVDVDPTLLAIKRTKGQIMTQATFDTLVSNAAKGRFDGIERNYSAADVQRLRGSTPIRHTLAENGANRLWSLLHDEPFVNALGALSGNQAMQMVRAGLKAIYLSGWQVAADANVAGGMYPDQSLYPANSGPELARKINKTLQRADQIEHAEGKMSVENWFAPIVADAEAGFGGPLNAFEIMKAYIVAARLAADTMGVATLIVARTDAEAAKLLTSDIDERDRPFVKAGARTSEGFYHVKNGIDPCIARAIAYAPYADLIWCETSTPDLVQAKKFAEAVHKAHPGKMLAYNCSPSFNWKKKLDDATIAKFQRELGAMGYKFQFITLAGFHQLNFGMYELAKGYQATQMAAYSKLQEAEFAAEANGYTATRHQREVGTGYFDAVSTVISGGQSSTGAMSDSTETAQFKAA
jgi:isocitrate lyase